jgi:sugar phosphate permease
MCASQRIGMAKACKVLAQWYVAASELDKDTALGLWKCGKQCGGFLTAEFVPDLTVVSANSLVFWR